MKRLPKFTVRKHATQIIHKEGRTDGQETSLVGATHIQPCIVNGLSLSRVRTMRVVVTLLQYCDFFNADYKKTPPKELNKGSVTSIMCVYSSRSIVEMMWGKISI